VKVHVVAPEQMAAHTERQTQSLTEGVMDRVVLAGAAVCGQHDLVWPIAINGSLAQLADKG
jgi:hypothetical protein